MTGLRDAIQDAMRNALIVDSLLAALTGGTASDPRVYAGYDRAERTVNATYPGYISIFVVTTAEPMLDREEFRFQVTCFALRRTTVNKMADRIDALLHDQALSPSGWSDVSCRRIGETALYVDKDGVHQLNTDYRVRVA